MTLVDVCAVLAFLLALWGVFALVRGAVVPAIILFIAACVIGPGGYWLLSS